MRDFLQESIALLQCHGAAAMNFGWSVCHEVADLVSFEAYSAAVSSTSF
jgi:hypothetical protein